jgi:hypothetical protein
MTVKQLTYLLFITTLTFGCGRHWVRTESSYQIIWKKINKKQDSNSLETLSDNCSLIAGTTTKTGKFNDYNYYEFDTIRIYVQQTDELLNKMIQKGFIQGQYFFSPKTTNSCQPRQWTNPTKSDHNNWYGYNFYVAGLREIKTTKFPKPIRKKIDLYKVFRISFSYIGQPYINPEVFRFELTNKEYKCNQDTISFDIFIDRAKTTNFYQNGFEI